ncbi:hypothetical protein DL767_003404 [Monosporascus sp. MG133]|nr:hypothetical protein DL767_003404 [Monosporascus sp. MG133]
MDNQRQSLHSGLHQSDEVQNAVPLLESSNEFMILNNRSYAFTNSNLVDNQWPQPPPHPRVPDFWDGIDVSDVGPTVREVLDKLIVPKNHLRPVPIVANFFLEAKRPTATGRVAEKQALNDGAYGARASFGRSMCLLDVEQFEEDADLSDEEGDGYHGDDDGTEDSEDSEEVDSE